MAAVNPEVSPTLADLRLADVASAGVVLKRNSMFPVETIMVGIPATVATQSACTHFVGQETTLVGKHEIITAKGATDPMIDACIDIYPEPVNTVLTTTFQVNNELFKSRPPVSKVVVLDGRRYRVTLKNAHEVLITLLSR